METDYRPLIVLCLEDLQSLIRRRHQVSRLCRSFVSNAEAHTFTANALLHAAKLQRVLGRLRRAFAFHRPALLLGLRARVLLILALLVLGLSESYGTWLHFCSVVLQSYGTYWLVAALRFGLGATVALALLLCCRARVQDVRALLLVGSALILLRYTLFLVRGSLVRLLPAGRIRGLAVRRHRIRCFDDTDGHAVGIVGLVSVASRSISRSSIRSSTRARSSTLSRTRTRSVISST